LENLCCGSGEGWLRVQVYWRTRITISESQTNHRGKTRSALPAVQSTSSNEVKGADGFEMSID